MVLAIHGQRTWSVPLVVFFFFWSPCLQIQFWPPKDGWIWLILLVLFFFFFCNLINFFNEWLNLHLIIQGQVDLISATYGLIGSCPFIFQGAVGFYLCRPRAIGFNFQFLIFIEQLSFILAIPRATGSDLLFWFFFSPHF